MKISHWRTLASTLVLGAMVAACEESPTLPVPVEEETNTSLVEASLDAAAAEVAALRTQLTDRNAEDRTRDGRPNTFDRVGVIVEIGAASVDLAKRLIENDVPNRRQLQLLRTAQELQRQAEAALQAGHTDRAVRLAVDACWTALKAVVLPGGVTPEEIRAMQELAEELLTAAVADIGDDPTETEALLIDWSIQFYVVGNQQVEAGNVRGVAWLWKSAVVASYLLQ